MDYDNGSFDNVTDEEDALQQNIWGFYYGYYYQIYHPLTLIFCVSGILTNLINIAVLTRPEMRNSTNIIFTGIVIADIVLVASHGCRSIIYYACPTLHQFVDAFTTMYIYGMYTVEYGSLLMSEWIAVTLGIWRLIAVTWPLKVQFWCGEKQAIAAIVATTVASLLVTIPCFFLVSKQEQMYQGQPIHLLAPWAFAGATYSDGHVGYLVVLCVAIVLPLLVLIVITAFLIRNTWRATKDRKKLNISLEKEGFKANRTTLMLIIMLSTFIFTNAPAIVLTVACLIPSYPTKFAITSYNNFFQSVLLFGSTTTFITYFFMSSKYRRTFSKLFLYKMKIFNRSKAGKSGDVTATTMSTTIK